jgi:hypothetical protein
MINWNDPDYAAAGTFYLDKFVSCSVSYYFSTGHFYALVSSVSIECLDPQAPGPNVTSYVYGQNVSADTPDVAFSTESTIDAAYSISAVNSWLRAVLAIVVGLTIAMQVM